MTQPIQEPSHVDEPQQVEGYAAVLSRVASAKQAVIVRRDGADLAAVVPMEYFEFLQDLMARNEAERLAATLDWDRLVRESPPPQSWFDAEEPRPF